VILDAVKDALDVMLGRLDVRVSHNGSRIQKRVNSGAAKGNGSERANIYPYSIGLAVDHTRLVELRSGGQGSSDTMQSRRISCASSRLVTWR
jgi:hypothetical protein